VKFAGTWHITEMDEWDEDYCNMEVQAYLKLDQQGNGEFQFGLVHGYIVDGWVDDDGTAYEFRWKGNAEMDEASGSCLLGLLDKDHLEGELTFDNGDSSGFMAERAVKK
jgi:hypothetical protein